MRQVRAFIWAHPDDCIPPHGLDMSWEHDVSKVEMLRQAFAAHGFDKAFPALVGYPLNGRIQLVSGTHRHLAAQQANIMLPITIWLRSDVEETWGTELWAETIRDITVYELEKFFLKDGFHRSPYDGVDLASMLPIDTHNET